MKKIVVIPAAVAVVSLSAYSGIWFFKTSQFKKQINEFVSKDSEHLSVGEITVSGFPLAQKITVKDFKFSVPENGGEIVVKSLEATTGALSSTYSIQVLDAVEFSSQKENINIKVELNPDTKIEIVTQGNQEISQIKFAGSGYKITDKQTNKIILSETEKDSKTEIFLEGENFLYKHQDSGVQIFDEKNNIILSSASSFADVSYTTDKDKKTTVKVDANIKDFEYFNLDYIYKKLSVDENISDANVAAASLPSDVKPEGKLEKTSVAVNVAVEVTRNEDKMVDILPADQMEKLTPELKPMYQKKAAPYSVAVDLKNFELASGVYKVALNGKVSTYPEDVIPFPSGILNLKIEHFDDLVKLVMGESSRFTSSNPQLVKDKADTQAKIDKVVAIIKDVAAKNSQTVESTLAFEIKHDKNDGFNLLINNMAGVEILAKITEIDTPKAVPAQSEVVQNPQPVVDVKSTKSAKNKTKNN